MDVGKPNLKWERPSHCTDGKAEVLQGKVLSEARGEKLWSQVSFLPTRGSVLCTGHRHQLSDHGGTGLREGVQFHKCWQRVEALVLPARG